MNRRPCVAYVIGAVLAISSTTAVAAPEKVRFSSLDQGADGKPLVLDGYWHRPAGRVRFPAVVMLHGCSGALSKSGKITERFATMAQLLVDAGYGVLLVDSFNPRGTREICTTARNRRQIQPEHRWRDAYGALHYLSNRPDVVPEKIGAIGFSHGATAAIQVVDQRLMTAHASGRRFAASIAFYPGCSDVLKQSSRFATQVPLLVLAGQLDDWTPVEPCERLAARSRGQGEPTELVVYPNAYHGFDSTAPVRVRTDVWGGQRPVHVGGDAPARADAYRRVREFFGRHLGA